MHIIRTKAALIRTQALSPAVGMELTKISMMLFIKQISCHFFGTLPYSLAIEENWAKLN